MPIGGGSGGGGSAIRAGRAFVELSLDDNKVLRSLANVQQRFSQFGSFLRRMGGALIGLGSAITAPLLGALKVFESAGDKLDKMAGRTGLAVEFLSALDFAAQRSGSSIEEFESAIKNMQRSLLMGAGPELENAKGAIKELGLSLDDVQGKSPEEQFLTIAEALANIEDHSLRAALAQRVFGRSGTGILNLIAKGAGGVRELMGIASEANIVVTKEEAKAAADFADAMLRIKSQIKAILMQVGSSIAGPIMDFMDRLSPILAGTIEWVKRNKELITIIAAVGGAITVAGGLLVGFGLAASVASTAIGGALWVVGWLKAGLLLLLTPLGIVTALAVGLGVAWATLTPEGQNFIETMKGGFGELLETVKTAWAGIADALRTGDFVLAGRIAFTALKLEWAKVVLFWTDKWNQFKGFFVDGWHDAIFLLTLAWNDFTAVLKSAFIDVMIFLKNSFGDVIRSMFEALARVARKLPGGGVLAQLLTAAAMAAAMDVSVLEATKRGIEPERSKLEDEIHKAKRAADEARKEAREKDLQEALADIERLERELAEQRAAAGEALQKQDAFDAGKALGEGFGEAAAKAAAAGAKAISGFTVSSVAGGLATPGLGAQFGLKAGSFEKQALDNDKKMIEALDTTASAVVTIAKNFRWH